MDVKSLTHLWSYESPPDVPCRGLSRQNLNLTLSQILTSIQYWGVNTPFGVLHKRYFSLKFENVFDPTGFILDG